MSETAKLQLIGNLVNSSAKFAREMAMMPRIVLSQNLQNMTLKYGIRGQETLGTMRVNAQFRPYKTEKGATGDAKIEPRTITTFLGDVVHEYDPYELFTSCYDFPLSKDIITHDVIKNLALEIARACSENILYELFTATRNAAGTTTHDLFDGFATIVAKEIVAGNIATAKKNYQEVEAITSLNAGEVLLGFYRNNIEDALKKNKNLTMYVKESVKEAYDDWFADNFTAASYNTEFDRSVLHGARNVKIESPVGMENVPYIFLTTKDNMVVGCDGSPDGEDVAELRRCDNPKVVQYFAKTFIGTQLRSIHGRDLKIGKINEPESSGSASASASASASGSGSASASASASGSGSGSSSGGN